MFVSNKIAKNSLLDGWSEFLSEEKMNRLKTSAGYAFYEIIFCNIKEEDFRVLYSRNHSAPNSPVNRLVGALFLLHKYNWTYEQLIGQIEFNVEIRIALGLRELEEVPFSVRTLFNFKNRLFTHHKKTGENLLEGVFLNLTEQQLEELNVKTGIQRGDSVLLNSNIQRYSRLSLLVEVIRRVYYELSEGDQQCYSSWFLPYLKGGEHYVYNVGSGEYAHHLASLAAVYYGIHSILSPIYDSNEVFEMFERVYEEHFKEEVGLESPIPIMLRPKEELNSGTLQSPDDLDATFRTKRQESYQGFVAFGAETCDPENELNLVTALSVATNNTDDSVLLEAELDGMKKLTPDLNEFHNDGGFGSEGVDAKAAEHGIQIVQTAVKGPTAAVPMVIEGNEKEGYTVSCPNPEHPPVEVEKAKINFKATFDLNKCETCPFRDQCPTRRERRERKRIAIFRFKPTEILRQKRNKALQKIPKERRTIRAAVENLMGLLRRGEKHTGKLKVRGLENMELYIFSMGVVINFERIFRYKRAKNMVLTCFYQFLALQRTTGGQFFGNQRIYNEFI